MKPRKPETKTGNSMARGSSLDEHHGNLKNPKKPQKCFCHASDILMKGCEFFYQNTGLFKLSLYSFTFLCVARWSFVLVSITDFSHIQAGRKLSAELCWECGSLFREEESDGFRSQFGQNNLPHTHPQNAKHSESWNFNTASEDFSNRRGNWTFFNISRK